MSTDFTSIKEERDKIYNEWKDSGILDGLSTTTKTDWSLFESKPNQKIESEPEITDWLFPNLEDDVKKQ